MHDFAEKKSSEWKEVKYIPTWREISQSLDFAEKDLVKMKGVKSALFPGFFYRAFKLAPLE